MQWHILSLSLLTQKLKTSAILNKTNIKNVQKSMKQQKTGSKAQSIRPNRDIHAFSLDCLQLIYISNFMLQNNRIQTKPLKQIIGYIPNILTALRFGLNYLAAVLFASSPQLASLLLMVSVILDYFDGWAARKYNQCSFFGDVFDWVTDILTLALVLFWWNNIEPQFIVLSFSLLALEIATMVCDLVFKSADCEPKLDCDTWASVILKYTMHTEKRGYSGKGIGYWNQIFYFLCILSRILYVITENNAYFYLFASCVPLSISYVWMHYAFTANIMEKWSEKYEDKQIRLDTTDQ